MTSMSFVVTFPVKSPFANLLFPSYWTSAYFKLFKLSAAKRF